MINHVGRYTLIRWKPGDVTLSVKIARGEGDIWGPDAPELGPRWQCFFVSHFDVDRPVTFTYKRKAA